MQAKPPVYFFFSEAEEPTLYLEANDKQHAEELYDYINHWKSPYIVMTADKDMMIELHIYKDKQDRLETSSKIASRMVLNRIDYWDIKNLRVTVLIQYNTTTQRYIIDNPTKGIKFKAMSAEEFDYSPL